jgi:carbon-monoxide dehydrogenase medium subunit
MYPAEFDYYRPASVAEAIGLLKTKENAKLLAGGHSLIPAMKLRLAQPGALIDIGRIAELKAITTHRGSVEIGAMATHAAVAASGDVRASAPLLAETAALIGDQQVRNRGTIGGSLAHADPAADYPTAFLALNGTINVMGSSGARSIKASDFFTGLFTTALAEDEVITSVQVPVQMGNGAYEKHLHPASGYAVVGVAVVLAVRDGKVGDDVTIVAGGATNNPVRCLAAERALAGQAPSAQNIAAAAAKVADAIGEPMGDIYASGEYRVHLATVLAKRALARAANAK